MEILGLEYEQESDIKTKRCPRCECHKPLEEFGSFEKCCPAYCKPCAAEKQRIYRKNNQERVRATEIKRHQKRYANQREKILARNKNWEKRNPEKSLIRLTRHKAKKFSAPINDFTAEQWIFILTIYKNRCAYCDKKQKKLTQDHITPLSKDGPNTMTNIVPACGSCNSRKHNGPPLRQVQPILPLI